MHLTRSRLMGAAVVAVFVTASGAALLAQRVERPAAPPAGGGVRGGEGRDGAGEVHGVVKAADADKLSLTIAGSQGRGEATPDRTFSVAKDAEVLIDQGRGPMAAREGKLSDLAAGAVVSLRLADDKKTVDALFAEGPTMRGTLTGVDATKGTLTVSGGGGRGRGEEAAPDKTWTVSKAVEVLIDDGRGRRSSLREAKLSDLTSGCVVALKLTPNQKEVVSVQAEGSGAQGTVKAVDAGKRTITLVSGAGRGEAGEEKTYSVAEGTDVFVEETRPRRFFSTRLAKLDEVPVGAMVSLRLAPDMSTATVIRAEGPTVSGTLKSVDSGKGTVIIVVGAGRGTDGEEKSYPTDKDVKVFIDGNASKLADLKSGDNPSSISLKLSLDQKTVRSIQYGSANRGSR